MVKSTNYMQKSTLTRFIKSALLVFSLGVLIISGCKKDEAIGPNGDGKNCFPTEMQVGGKISQKFTFNGSNQLETYDQYSAGLLAQRYRVVRKDGKITQVDISNNNDELANICKFTYNGSQVIRYEKYKYDFVAKTEKLTNVYIYNYKDGRVDTIFHKDGNENPTLKMYLIYDSKSNITGQKQYDPVNPKSTVNMEDVITYDESPNIWKGMGLPIGVLGFEDLTLYSQNNPLEVTRTNYKGGTFKVVTKYGYDKNSSGYPTNITTTVDTKAPVTSTVSYNCK